MSLVCYGGTYVGGMYSAGTWAGGVYERGSTGSGSVALRLFHLGARPDKP
jgi:hypothetical protein